MKFNELEVGKFLYFRYDSTTGAYFYIDRIEDGKAFYIDIRILHRKNEFTYSYDVCHNSTWDDRDFIFSRLEECDEDKSVLIEYIFEYKEKK